MFYSLPYEMLRGDYKGGVRFCSVRVILCWFYKVYYNLKILLYNDVGLHLIWGFPKMGDPNIVP